MPKKKTTEETESKGIVNQPNRLVNKYELVVIYPTSENEIAAERQVTEYCKKHSLKVVEVDKWGTKTLAYEIKKQPRGYYLRLVLEGTAQNARLLEKDLQMNDKLLRFLLVRI